MNRSRFTILPKSIIWVLCSLAILTGQNGGLTPAMVVAMKGVTSVAPSPDGSAVAYTLFVPRAADEKPGAGRTELWLVSKSGGESVQLVASPLSVSGVAWRPDGKVITFRAKIEEQNEHNQIYSIDPSGSEPQLLSEHVTSIGSYSWSPNGRQIAFISTDPVTDAEKADQEAGKDWIIPDENLKHRRLWTMTARNGKIAQLSQEEMSIWSFVWAPNSRSIYFQATETPSVDDSYMFRKIYSISARGGKTAVLTETEGKLGGMAVSPDGKQLAYAGAVSLNDPLAQSLFIVSTRGGKPVNLTLGYEGSLGSLLWLDKSTLLMEAVEGTGTVLYSVDAGSGDRQLQYRGPLVFRQLRRADNGSLAAVAHSSAHPSELFTASAPNGDWARRTWQNPEIEAVRLARQETISWTGADDWNIQGILTWPLDYQPGQRYPLVLQVHGGPEGVSLDGWTTSSLYPVQVLAAAGYFVLQPNYRGSGGRGVAFSKGDHDDLGGKEFADILAGIDHLEAQGLIDPDRVGTGGWSYGGYMSAWAATRHSKLFKAAIVAAGLTNWISFTGTTDIPYEMSLVHWNQWWYEDPELHWRRSPVAYINEAQTPTLVVHGQVDTRVHPEQSLQLYQFLKLKGVPTKLILYPREPHGLRERAHQEHFIHWTVDWFDTFLRGAD